MLDEAKLWRVNGVKQKNNPMPLADLADKASCRLTFEADAASVARRAYGMLARRLELEGWAFLSYGVLIVKL
jgi:hypothetical protein